MEHIIRSHVFHHSDICLCAPTVADDIMLLSILIKSMQTMIDTCYRYSCKWRFQYNPSKCAILVFNENKRAHFSSSRPLKLGDSIISEVDSYTHLGVTCYTDFMQSNRVRQYSDKIRRTFYGVLNPQIVRQLNPLTCKKIYDRVVLPKALYGSECLHNLSSCEILSLERSHRHCIKAIQGFSTRTRTDVALSMINALPIKAEIDKRKLTILGQLCRLNRDCAVKRIFLYRLFHYKMNAGRYVLGFFPDVFTILERYNLSYVLDCFFSDGTFPSKFKWKRLLMANIWHTVRADWSVRYNAATFDRVRSVHCQYNFNEVWMYAYTHPLQLPYCKTICKLIANLSWYKPACHRCGVDLVDTALTDHVLLDCKALDAYRLALSSKLRSVFGLELTVYIRGLDREAAVSLFLGARLPEMSNLLHETESYTKFQDIVFRNIHFMWLYYTC